MKLSMRILVASLLLIVDSAIFFLPLTAIVVVVCIIARPKWAESFVKKIYS